MYRDSDGYILIDMGAADISKSTQSIVGFYDRIVESVSANKLVLVINFGTYSPMPAIAHKKLNYYEIVTNLYKITINSNDIVIIEETGESTVDVSIVPTLQEGVKIADFAIGEVEGSIYAPEQADVINDNVTASNTTWSSDKIDNELDAKADTSTLATVATSGSYNDLTNKPTLAAVATSGSYNDLTNKPTLAAVATSGSYDDLTNKPTLAAVAKSGSYNDLTNKPDIPTLVTGTVSVSSGVTMKDVQLYKYGRVIYFRVEVKVASPTYWQTIASIPSEYRPLHSVYGVMDKTANNSGTLTAHIDVETNGNVRLANLLPDANSEYRFALTWII